MGGQKSTLITKNGTIQTGKWYDLRVELSSGRIKCFIDDQLIHDFEMESPEICVSSALDKVNNEIIVKLVNPTEEDVTAKINLDGISKSNMTAKVLELSGNRGDVNNLENPEKVKTRESDIKVGNQFECSLSACSVKMIRVNVK